MGLKRLFVLLILVAIISLGCGKKNPPEPPKITSIRDMPADNGQGVILSWFRFNASPLAKYEIWRGESIEKMKKVGVKNYQLAPEEKVIDSSNYVGDLGYYLVVKQSGDKIPKVEILKGNTGNPEAEKIVWVETKVVLGCAGNLKDKYVDGEFYRIRKDKGFIESRSVVELKGYAPINQENGLILAPDNKVIRLTLEKSPRVLEFLRNAEPIQAPDPATLELQKEYGTRITAFITDAGVRYSMIWLEDQYVDVDTTLKPKTRYYYKIRAYYGYRKFVESDTVSIVPVDDEPTPPAITGAIYDSAKGEAIISWNSPDSDIKNFRLVRISDKSGEEKIAEVGGSWTQLKLSGLKDNEVRAKYRLVSTDRGGKEAQSDTFRLTAGKIPDPPPLPENFTAKDMPNDNATGIVLRWGHPRLSLGYTSLNIMPAPKYSKLALLEGKFFAGEREGKYQILPSGIKDSTNYQKIVSAEIADMPKPEEPFDILVTYEKQTNGDDNVGFVKLQLDSLKPVVDFTDDGRYVFNGISKGKHTITGWILTRSGNAIEETKTTLTFTLPEELEGGTESEPYIIELYRGQSANTSNLEKIITLPATFHEYQDKISTKPVDDSTYYYFMRVVNPEGNFADTKPVGPVQPKENLFHRGKISVLVMLGIFFVIAIYFLLHAQKGRTFYIRPIAGISHVDEALGRATEMGRPILYVLGLDGIPAINTLAGITILGRVARKAAEYQLRVLVPAYDPLTMLVAQETVRSSFTDAGRPDLFNESDVFFVTDSQFAYAAAVSGIMVREKTATNFYMGGFYAESLLLAEAGASTGAIQIAGTDAMTQLPFFITTCDYTLMGEELYAASAYLSQDPAQIASLKIQDLNKFVIMVIMLAGIIMISFGWHWLYNFFLVQLQ